MKIGQKIANFISGKKTSGSSGVEKKSNKRTDSGQFKRPEVQSIGSRDVNRTQPERGRTDRKQNADMNTTVHADVSAKLVTVILSLDFGNFDLASAELDDIENMLADVVKRHFEGSGKTFKKEDLPAHVKRLFKKEHLHEALKNLGQKSLEKARTELGKRPQEGQGLGHGLMSELTNEVKREFLFRAKSHAIATVQKYEAANQTLSDPEMAYLKEQVQFLLDNLPKEGKGPTEEHLKGLQHKIQQAEDKAEKTSTGSWASYRLDYSEGGTNLLTQRAVSQSENRSEDEGARSESEESEVQTKTETATERRQKKDDLSNATNRSLIGAMGEEEETGTDSESESESEPKAQNGKANRLTGESEAIGDSEETSSVSGSESASASASESDSDSDMDAAALARVTDEDLSNADVTGLRRLFKGILQVLPTQTTLQGVLVLKNLADKLERTADRHANSSATSAKAKKLASDVQGVVAKIDALVIDALLKTERSAIGGLIFDDLDGLRDLKALKDAVELYQSHAALDAPARKHLKGLSSDIKQVELGFSRTLIGYDMLLANVGIPIALGRVDATLWSTVQLIALQQRIALMETVYVPDALKSIQKAVLEEMDRRNIAH